MNKTTTTHPFELPMSDGSRMFGKAEVEEIEEMCMAKILELYYETPLEPGCTVAMVTCLNSLIPALHMAQIPMQQLGLAIVAQVYINYFETRDALKYH
jgi:hypothetical protein